MCIDALGTYELGRSYNMSPSSMQSKYFAFCTETSRHVSLRPWPSLPFVQCRVLTDTLPPTLKSYSRGCNFAGRLRPNTLVIGYKNDWAKNIAGTKDYVDILRAAFANLFGCDESELLACSVC